MASVLSTSSGRRAACKDRDQLNSTKHVPETSASLPTSPGAPPVGDLVRGKEARQKFQENGPPPWRYSVLRPSVEGGSPGALPVEAQTWGKDNGDASSRNSFDAVVITPGTSSRPLPFRSRRPHPVRCRREVSPKVGAKSPRTVSPRTKPPRTRPSLHGCRNPLMSGRNPPVSGKLSLSGIPGSYSSLGIHEPSSRLCCPGGSFERNQSAGCIFVPRPNTARPEGGCLTIHQSSSHPLPFWLKRLLREELEW